MRLFWVCCVAGLGNILTHKHTYSTNNGQLQNHNIAFLTCYRIVALFSNAKPGCKLTLPGLSLIVLYICMNIV